MDEKNIPLTPRQKLELIAFVVSIGAVMYGVSLISSHFERKDKENAKAADR